MISHLQSNKNSGTWLAGLAEPRAGTRILTSASENLRLSRYCSKLVSFFGVGVQSKKIARYNLQCIAYISVLRQSGMQFLDSK